jgi:SAM-dependent methyltransferase
MGKKRSKQQKDSSEESPIVSPSKNQKAKKEDGGKKGKKPTFSGTKRSRNNDDGEPREEQWSKSKKKRMRLIKAKQNKREEETSVKELAVESSSSEAKLKVTEHSSTKDSTTQGKKKDVEVKTTQSSALQKSFQERLSGSRFRILNEELYTTTSSTAFNRFQQNPALFDEYHEGFRHQVEQWPINPVTVLVKQLKALVKTKIASPTNQQKVVVADFGCGDAELAKQLLAIIDAKKQCPFTVHSFDLVAKGPNAELITASDVANTPLKTGSVDVGIFCLSLMGTNLSDFIREAHRVLKPDARMHIAEVRSRFESFSKNKSKDKSKPDETDQLQTFIQVLDQLGFECYRTDRSNKMFVLLELKKNGKKPKKDLAFTAKPCIYKRR